MTIRVRRRRHHRLPRAPGKEGQSEMAHKIVIVGAGCAGLGAATALTAQKEYEVDVTLLDPNVWIGGRAVTNPNINLPVDLGPQFVQDPEVNPWTVILKQLPEYKNEDIKPKMIGAYYRVLGEDGWETVFTNDGIKEGNELLETGFKTATGFANAPVISSEMAKVFRGKQDLRLSLGSSGLGAIAESVEPWQYVASDQDRQTEYPGEGNNIYVPGGLGNLVKTYGEKLLAANEMILHWQMIKVVAIKDKHPEELTLITESKSKLKFDYCIVTVPNPEVGKIKFTPPLSGARLRADSFIRLGSYKKVAFRPTIFPVGEENDCIKPNTEYYIYDSTSDGVWQYFRLPTDPTILICVTAGDFARKLDGEPDDTAIKLVIGLLSQAYKGDFTPLKDEVVVTNWTNQPNIHGAYSYTHHDELLDRDNPVPLQARLEIAKPHGRVHFAGEATWADAYGTIHGAYHSGVRAAEEILAVIRSTSS
jgi:monoamine oxidase